MRRREFIALSGGAAVAWPLGARAGEGKLPIVGLLLLYGQRSAPLIHAFLQGLQNLGWIEGENVIIEIRSAGGRVDRLPELAAELVRLNVDVIFANTSLEVEAAKQAMPTTPIVFAAHADPIGVGHVTSLSHPGGNITGMSQLMTELAAKSLEILKEAIPGATRIGVLWNPMTPSHGPALKSVALVAENLSIQLQNVSVQSPAEFDDALSTMKRAGCGAFIVMSSVVFYPALARLAELALKHGLPGTFPYSENVREGGLMSYSVDLLHMYRSSARYVDRILKGAKPADLPVEQTSKYALVINLKTAKALGLTLPTAILARADEVIE